MKFPDKLDVLTAHARLIAETGGSAGLRDEGLLESALAAAENRHGYEDADLATCAATYAFAFADAMCRISRLRVPIVTEWRSLKWTATRKSYRPFDRRLDQSSTAQVSFKVDPRRCCILCGKEPAKHAELKSVAYFQHMQRSKSQWCLNAV
jgi:hypothetical protein